MTRTQYPLLICILSLLVQFTGVSSQGTGVEVRPEMNYCSGAAGPRPISDQSSPGTTVSATVDDVGDVNGGFCGVEIDTPGIWWWVNGTGSVIRASSCDERTQIKVKMSVFTGSCDALRCVAGGSRPDFECDLVEKGPEGEWGTVSTAIDFPTYEGQHYYILVQQMSTDTASAGDVWMRFRHPNTPQNDHCIDAIGPVPRNMFTIESTTVDASLSEVPEGFCDGIDYYPGVWYQIIGTGSDVKLSACGETNTDGFYFSVYHGGFCDDKTCVTGGSYEILIEDQARCTFGPPEYGNWKPMTRYTFPTIDRDRYFIYVHYALTGVDTPTSPFRFFVDDGKSGNGGSSGADKIEFTITDDSDANGGNGTDGSGGSSNNGGNNDGKSDAPSVRSSLLLQVMAGGIVLFLLSSSFLLL